MKTRTPLLVFGLMWALGAHTGGAQLDNNLKKIFGLSTYGSVNKISSVDSKQAHLALYAVSGTLDEENVSMYFLIQTTKHGAISSAPEQVLFADNFLLGLKEEADKTIKLSDKDFSELMTGACVYLKSKLSDSEPSELKFYTTEIEGTDTVEHPEAIWLKKNCSI